MLGCSNKKQVFICGDHICINNKEMKEFFSENLYIEVAVNNKKIEKEENIDLVQLNIPSTSKENIENTKTKKYKKLNKIEKKKKLKELKILEKKAKNTKNKIKQDNKKIVKLNTNRSNKIEKIDKQIFLNKKQIIKASDYCDDLLNCDIDKVSDLIIKSNRAKDYPKINMR